jgi:hypothetical protein
MVSAFVAPCPVLPSALRPAGLAATHPPRARVAHPPRARAARRTPRAIVLPPVAAPDVRAEKFAAMAATAAQFLSLELKDHLANYAVKFGSQIKEKELINEIACCAIREDGLDIDIVTCDQYGCVCLREKVAWLPEDTVCDADDLIPALQHLSKACGLDDSMLT